MMNQLGEEIYDFKHFRFPNNVIWDGKEIFFYMNSNKSIIVVNSQGKEVAWITSPSHLLNNSAEFRFINDFIQLYDFDQLTDASGEMIGKKEYCEYFKYTGEKVILSTEKD